MLNPDFRDILFIFIEEKVDFLLVGAYALAAHGHPRATGDIDLWVKCSAENAQRIWNALIRFGAPMDQVTLQDFQTEGLVFQMGTIPRRIDLIMSLDGLEFDAARSNRIDIELEGMTIPVIGRADLLANKKITGRPKDLADIAWLENTEPQT